MAAELTEEAALATILAPRNRRREVWTATVLLDRMGINRTPVPSYAQWSKANRLKARRNLESLWRKGKIVRALQRDTRNTHLAFREIAYRRWEDASGKFLVPCDACGKPRLCVNRDGQNVVGRCRKCGADSSR